MSAQARQVLRLGAACGMGCGFDSSDRIHHYCAVSSESSWRDRPHLRPKTRSHDLHGYRGSGGFPVGEVVRPIWVPVVTIAVPQGVRRYESTGGAASATTRGDDIPKPANMASRLDELCRKSAQPDSTVSKR
jgi:hypothetical protein